MEDSRHPITDAGIGPLLETARGPLVRPSWIRPNRWSTFRDGQLVGSRPCTLIEVTHPRRAPDFLFYRCSVYIDGSSACPIRFEAYDWPASPEAAPELVEEYTYTDLKLNVGLGDLDFDVSNDGLCLRAILTPAPADRSPPSFAVDVGPRLDKPASEMPTRGSCLRGIARRRMPVDPVALGLRNPHDRSARRSDIKSGSGGEAPEEDPGIGLAAGDSGGKRGKPRGSSARRDLGRERTLR